MDRVHAILIDGPITQLEPALPPGAACGAVNIFLGIVRNDEHGIPISGLEYTTYDPMAQRVLVSLAEQAIEKFGVMHVHVEHSRGLVPVGACSLRLTIAGAHRQETLDATAWYIDTMKRDAPIWKRPIPAKSPPQLVGEER